MRSTTNILLALALATTVSCSQSTTKKSTTCVPGNVVECPCPGGEQGEQTCQEDNTFDECGCDGVNSGWDLGEPSDMDQPVDTRRPIDFGRPDLSRPDFGQPDFGQPEVGMPDLGRPDMNTSRPGDCSSPNPPARCSEDPNTTDWDSASILEFVFVEGTEVEPICCYDFTGDGQIDNALGQNLASFAFLADINNTLDQAISTGSIAIVLEHQDLTTLSGTYQLNWWPAEWGPTMSQISVSQNPVLLSPAGFDQGAHPFNYFPSATLSQGVLTASGGTVAMPLALFDVDLMLTIRRARLEASLVAMSSGVPNPGLTLRSGVLGGVVTTQDIFVAVNEVARTCTCLGLGSQRLVDPQNGMCSQNANAQRCEDQGQVTCAELAGSCNLFGAIGLFADVDLDGDGLNDAVSIGVSWTARPAQITGVAP